MIVQISDYYYYNTILKRERTRVTLRDNRQIERCNTQHTVLLSYLYVNEYICIVKESELGHTYIIIIDKVFTLV